MSAVAEKLVGQIKNQDATVGIIGMGYVGLPLALLFAETGFQTTGFDLDDNKIRALNDGHSYIKHISGDTVSAVITTGEMAASTDFARLADMDVVIICVPTPLSANRDPDLSYVISTTETIAKTLHIGQLVILESTTYPGTSDEVVRPLLEAAGLRSGSDFFLAYSPEREDPGNPNFSTRTIPKVVGGDGDLATRLAETLYGQVIDTIVPVSTMDTAEAIKLTENVFRSVNIALVNELKVIYAEMGIDIWEVIKGASTKPFGYMPFYPGPGLGGHCIPIDPFYLSWKARQLGMRTRFIELAGEINTDMPIYVVNTLMHALDDRFDISLPDAKVLIIGIAYKKNCDDMRESPALAIIELLEQRGAVTAFHDPYVPEIPKTRKHQPLAGRASVPLDTDHVASFDAVLICADHDGIDYAKLVTDARLVIDTRNATDGITNRESVIKA